MPAHVHAHVHVYVHVHVHVLVDLRFIVDLVGIDRKCIGTVVVATVVVVLLAAPSLNLNMSHQSRSVCRSDQPKYVAT